MAIKIKCSSCGFQNDLGRVFCAQCGQKLDLRDTSMESLEDRRVMDWGRLVRWVFTLVILGALAAIVGLALWPVKAAPVYYEAVGAKQVPVKVSGVLRALSYNKAITLDLQEGELNGFLAERAKVKRLASLTIDLKPGSFNLHAVMKWTPPTNLTYLAKVNVPLSMTLKGSFQGGVFFPGKAQVGHLPLPGKTQDVVTGFFASLLSDVINEKRMIDALRTVAIEELRVDLTLVPVGK